MQLYTEFYNVFINLIWGNLENFNARQANISTSTNNWLLDALNAILIRLPDIATMLFIIICFVVICWLPILLYKLCVNLDPNIRRRKR